MSDERLILQERFSELLRWERLKRRERIMVTVLFYSLLLSVSVLPAKELLAPWAGAFYFPPLFFLILAPGFFLRRPWGRRESLRALFLLDKTLRLEERAITAWEILGCKEAKGAEQLVIQEAGERLRGIDPRALFKREYSWHAILTPPLFLVWLLLVWLDMGVHLEKGVPGSQSISVAQRLKEFSRDLQERAKSQGLNESLKIAHALEELAEQNLKGEGSEKKLSGELAGIFNQIEDTAPVKEGESELTLPTTTREGLLDFKVELETLKPALLPGSAGAENKLEPEIRRRLATLPRLKEEIERSRLSIEKLEGKELRGLLERLEQGVIAELDRRTLLEIKEFLALLLEGIGGKEGREALQAQLQAEQGWLSETEKAKGKGSLPGDRPGTKGELSQTPPPFKAGAATQLKGLLGEGKGSSLTWRGEARGRESQISQEEILASYRRQAEEDLASERIPEGLKETIKRYFLSLGLTESKRGE